VSVLDVLEDVAEELVEHEDLVRLALKAVTGGGVDPLVLRQRIEDEMTAAATRRVKKALGVE
jgi:hypothetical protein